MVAEAGNEQGWWSHVTDYGCCAERMSAVLLKFPKRALPLKASLFSFVCSGTKVGLVKGRFWKSLKKDVPLFRKYNCEHRLKSNKGLMSLMRCMDVLRLTHSCVWRNPLIRSGLLFFFFLSSFDMWVHKGAVSLSVAFEGRYSQGREITLPPPLPRSPLPRQHYSCSNSIVSSILAHWAT